MGKRREADSVCALYMCKFNGICVTIVVLVTGDLKFRYLSKEEMWGISCKKLTLKLAKSIPSRTNLCKHDVNKKTPCAVWRDQQYQS